MAMSWPSWTTQVPTGTSPRFSASRAAASACRIQCSSSVSAAVFTNFASFKQPNGHYRCAPKTCQETPQAFANFSPAVGACDNPGVRKKEAILVGDKGELTQGCRKLQPLG